MGLSPKPQSNIQPKSWSDLDALLKANFEIQRDSQVKPSVLVPINEYEMSREEMIKEGQRNGYTVEDGPTAALSGPTLRFS